MDGFWLWRVGVGKRSGKKCVLSWLVVGGVHSLGRVEHEGMVVCNTLLHQEKGSVAE